VDQDFDGLAVVTGGDQQRKDKLWALEGVRSLQIDL
jgi:hypothetical protein